MKKYRVRLPHGYAPIIVIYFSRGLVNLYKFFSNEAATPLLKTTVPLMAHSKTKSQQSSLHAPQALLDIPSRQKGTWYTQAAAPLLYHLQVIREKLLLLQIYCLSYDNNSRIHLDLHTEIQSLFSSQPKHHWFLLIFFLPPPPPPKSFPSSTEKFHFLKYGDVNIHSAKN